MYSYDPSCLIMSKYVVFVLTSISKHNFHKKRIKKVNLSFAFTKGYDTKPRNLNFAREVVKTNAISI